MDATEKLALRIANALTRGDGAGEDLLWIARRYNELLRAALDAIVPGSPGPAPSLRGLYRDAHAEWVAALLAAERARVAGMEDEPARCRPVTCPEDHRILDTIYETVRHSPGLQATRESECVEFTDPDRGRMEIVVRPIDDEESQP